MPTLTAVAFRASFLQRAMGILLFAGSWMVGLRMGADGAQRIPQLWHLLKEAREGEAVLWIMLAVTVTAAALSILLLLFSLMVVLLLEGTQVLVDDLGLAVEIALLPSGLARRLGAGRLAWKRVGRVRRKGLFFLIESAEPPAPGRPEDPRLRFITVEELERLVLLIIEKSPNVKVE